MRIPYLGCTSKCRLVPIECDFYQVWAYPTKVETFLQAQIVFEPSTAASNLNVSRLTLFLEPPTRLNLNLNQMYLSKLENLFVKIAHCISQNYQMYLSKLPNIFVKI